MRVTGMAAPEERFPMCGQALPHFDKSDPDSLLRLLKLPAEGSTTGLQERDVEDWPDFSARHQFKHGESARAFGELTPIQAARASPSHRRAPLVGAKEAGTRAAGRLA
jgi:hypothetical protein